jgi:hypothetical protein
MSDSKARQPRRSDDMEHDTHEAGTVPECVHCAEVAYEPGWYGMLHRLSQTLEEAEQSVPAPPPPPPYAMDEAPTPPLAIPEAPVRTFV